MVMVVIAVVVVKTPQAAGENITDYRQNPPWLAWREPQ
jgi:hypothetical protein